MLNPYEHEAAEPLISSIRRMLGDLCALTAAAREEGLRIVYVNDNHGDWTAGPKEIAGHALAGAGPDLVKPVLPPEEVPCIVKARHSIFYETLLEYLLRREEIDRLVLAGQFEVVVATDAVAHIDERLAQAAIEMMQTNLHARLAAGPEAVLKACRA